MAQLVTQVLSVWSLPDHRGFHWGCFGFPPHPKTCGFVGQLASVKIAPDVGNEHGNEIT